MSTIIPDQIADGFTRAFASDIARDLAPRLTCAEAQALTDLLAELGSPHTGTWLDAHAASDSPSGDHYCDH